MKKKISIALLGHGTVGSAVNQIIKENSSLSEQIEVKRILIRNLEKHRVSFPNDIAKFTNEFSEIENDPQIDVIVELMGGEDPATDYILRAFKAGKHVVTANKLAIAKSGGCFDKAAKDSGKVFLYEASVAGAIPVIRVIEDSLVANRIYKICGIINGTTNYILTKMHEGSDFNEALLDAQNLGYAEANPSSDIDGDDAMYKIAILSKLCYDWDIDLTLVEKTPIKAVTRQMILEAQSRKNKIKYIASSENIGGKLRIEVGPREIDSASPLFNIEGATNAVILRCDNAGELMISGQGAGARPTASAVIADIVDLARKGE